MPSSPLLTANRREPAADSGELRSALLGHVFGEADPMRRMHIVDLGPARAATVDFFSRFRCRLYIADAMPALTREDETELDAEEQTQRFAARLRTALPTPASGEIDAVLCWDLLDYVPREHLSALALHIAPWLRLGGYLHAFISNRAEIPARPGRFTLLDEITVAYEPARGALRAAPRYHQLDLGRLMPQFAIERSVLLRNGLQEYLLRRR